MKVKGCQIIENYDLKKLTTYKLEGKTSFLAYPSDLETLIKLVKFLKVKKLKYKVIGGGSNLIFDGDYDGVIIKLDKFDKVKVEGNLITVGAGFNTVKLSCKAVRDGLKGFEFASGLYGTIGGAIANNSGCYKSDMSAVVQEVTVLTPDYEIMKMNNKACMFKYRTSFFEKNSDYIILEAKIKLRKAKKDNIKKLIQDRKKRRAESQPIHKACAGSVFRNPENLSAWSLVEETGFKGKLVGGAMVSEMHANFIVNENNATGKDIIKLIKQIQTKVKREKNIDLILEQEIVK